jgi:hypothetical protein
MIDHAFDYLTTTQQTVAWFKSMFERGMLDIAAPFQRNPVWQEPQKALLVDSILRGYPIPEIYLQDTVDAEGVERHVVVDGQQRIRACLEYAANSFPLVATESPEYGDASFDELDEDARQTFFRYRFVVRVLPEMPADRLRAIFGRLNRNVIALNAQELRHATYWGPFITLMEDIASEEFWPTSGVFSANDFRRMLDVELISELAVAYLHGPQNKNDRLDDWYAVHEVDFDAVEEVKATFRAVLGEIDQVLPTIARTRWRKKSDFYSLFLAFATRPGELPLSADRRTELTTRLVEFGRRVDLLARQRPDPAVDDADASEYSAAVVRAASDLRNRVIRQSVLERIVWA